MSPRVVVLAGGLVAVAVAAFPARPDDGYADEVRKRVAAWEAKPPAGRDVPLVPPGPGKRVSLHAGVNRLDPAKYPGTPGLAAAAEDARRLHALAAANGFTATLLTDEQATTKTVLAHMRAATQTLQAGDLYLVTFSGHGALVEDFNGDQYPRLTDQAFCLFDRMLVDDEVVTLWPDFRRGVKVLILLDACHSGTSEQSRAEFDTKQGQGITLKGVRQRGLPAGADVRVRAIDPDPHKAAVRVQRAELRAAIEPLRGVGDAIRRTQATVLRLAACKGDQVAVEFGGQGLFTRTMIELFQEYPTASYRELLYEAGRRVGVYQEPTLDHYGPDVDFFVRQPALGR